MKNIEPVKMIGTSMQSIKLVDNSINFVRDIVSSLIRIAAVTCL